MLLSLVVPVFNNAPLVGSFVEALSGRVSSWPFRSEVIFIDDASTDRTPEILNEYAKRFPAPFCLIQLDRNWGQSMAIVEGLKNASGDFAVTFPVDMEKNLPDIPRIVSEFMEQNASAMRVVREDRRYPSAFRKAASLAFNAVLKSFGLSMTDIGSSLYIAKKAYYQALIRPEYARFHKALPVLIWKLSGRLPDFPLTDRSIPQSRSSHSFWKLSHFAWDMILARLTPLAKSSEHPRDPVNQI